MGILQLPTPIPVMVGIQPQFKFMITTDSLATVTTAGYLNQVNLESNPIAPSDVLIVLYSYNQQTQSGTYGQFVPSVVNGVVTLSLSVNAGNVLLPVTSGDFATFNGTTGQIKDSGYLPSNAAKTVVSMVNAAPTSGNIAKFSDAIGTIADAGFALHAGTTASYAGGGTSNAFVTTNMTASSIVTAVILTSTNAVAIDKAVPGTNTLTVTFSADPGAGTTVSWISITPAVA